MNLYKSTLAPNPDLVDKLAFCGLVNSLGPYFPQAEMQARYVAALWSGTIECPSPQALQTNATATTNKHLDTSSILNQYDTSTIVNEDIGDELGITPSFLQAFWSPKKYLLGPVYACFYRTDVRGTGKDQEQVVQLSRKRFDQLIATSPQVPYQDTLEEAMASERKALLKFNIEWMVACLYLFVLVGRF